MIIKEIRIKNFRSYYGDSNRFELSDGLTLILGDNGDGKTTFFEALEWLFNTTSDKGAIENVSEMRKSKLEIGESDEVSVFMAFEHDGEKSIEKSFSFERTDKNSFRVSKVTYRGYETNGIERESVNGKALIERCYDAFIQKFSMFKGEAELDIFDNATLLKELVDKFSDIRKFDTLVEYTAFFEEKSNTAYTRELKTDQKVSKDAEKLDFRMRELAEQIKQKLADIQDKQESYEQFNRRLTQLEDNQETREKHHEIKERLKTQEDKATKLRANIRGIDYNHALLDRLWILCAFPDILNEFQQKCSRLSAERRRLERDFDKQQAAAKAKLETINEVRGALTNGATELPWYLPDQETMEEMLRDHVCKVCGRVAEEGSEAYHFMSHKLEQYKAHVEAKIKRDLERESLESQELFSNNYIEELHNFSMSLSGSQEAMVANISTEIHDRLELVERWKQELKKVEEKIAEITDEKTRLLIQAGNVSETLLESQFNDIKGLYQQKNRAEVRLTELRGELEVLKEQQNQVQAEIDELKPSGSKVKTLREMHRIISAIAKAFLNSKNENLRCFLADLEERSNEYLAMLSANDFHGEIRLVQTINESTEIHLFSSNGTEIMKPSGSQRTVMYISVLFAISDFTQQKREEDYPLIFDAATSSFGDSKEGDFYNVIGQVKKQCIIVTKDFISKGEVRKMDIQSLKCPVYRIKKASGYDPRNMATIRTTVERIK
ncbi:MAG: AAA family ATPase [Bacteroidaceae bacterium]|nr:AAA family ATPase [Bacteroidaceae bacterium]